MGGEAKAVIGRTLGSIVAVRPLKDGVIADFDITANMLENFRACGNSMFSCPRGHLVPSGVTEVECCAVKREATLRRPVPVRCLSLRSHRQLPSVQACPSACSPAA